MGTSTVRSSLELRDHYSDISKLCHESHKPVIITVDGQEDTAVMSFHTYRQMEAELELLRTLAEAEDDVAAGRIAPVADCFANIRTILQKEFQ
ncbi:MAG: type II toxin-antitoxin system Phd/YefM family antitoxin [Schwartzia succinivorans]|nr:type II toxin-antitoxin system Phd/YefM family antitoxin [Schwartzia succinivorans]